MSHRTSRFPLALLVLAGAPLVALAAAWAAQEVPKDEAAIALYTSGPMRLELVAIREQRVLFTEDPGAVAQPSTMAVMMKMRGDRLRDVVRIGHLIIEEMVDDTGRSLYETAVANTEDRLNFMRPHPVTDAIVEAGGIQFVEQSILAAAREAKTIQLFRGYVNTVFGSGAEEVKVDNLLRFAGSEIQHKRLAELGIRLKIYGPGQANIPLNSGSLGVVVVDGVQRFQGIDFYDDWLRTLPTRQRPSNFEGEPFTLYTPTPAGALITDDTTLMIKVLANVTEEKVPFVITNAYLP